MRPLRFCSPNSSLDVDHTGQGGFTLVEVIVSMLILSILGAFVSIGIARVFEGYVFSKDNAELTLKGEVAMARIAKELRSLDAVTSGTGTSLTYSFNKAGSSVSARTLTWSGTPGGQLLLGGNTLADNVAQFQITYHDSFTHDGDQVWNGSEVLIGIALTLNGTSGQSASFSTRLAPRNL